MKNLNTQETEEGKDQRTEMEEDDNQETTMEGPYKATKEAMQTVMERMNNTKAEVMEIAVKKHTSNILEWT